MAKNERKSNLPELPDLEVVRELLAGDFTGRTLTQVQILPRGTACLRSDPGEFEKAIGTRLVEIRSKGKVLLFDFEALTFVFEPKLGGRFRVRREADYKYTKLDCLSLIFSGVSIVFLDSRGMARVQAMQDRETEEMKAWGPSAISDFPLQYVIRALKQHRGEVKSLLLNPHFVSGIGNAYSDEILFHAGIHPFRKSRKLTESEAECLWKSIPVVLLESIDTLRDRITLENIDQEFRDHLLVHNRGGSPCPRCGHTISEITAGRRLTNFCRRCQHGGSEIFDR